MRGNPVPIYTGECRAMVFIDGENLAIRYADELNGKDHVRHVIYEKDVYVWSKMLCMQKSNSVNMIRRYYYTSATGDDDKLNNVYDSLKKAGIEAPRVFKKYKSRGSKRVDISLAVDMLSHAHRNNYDIAILVAGDEDYIPLVESVMAEGKRVYLWFLENGLHKNLKRKVDYFYDLKNVLFVEERY